MKDAAYNRALKKIIGGNAKSPTRDFEINPSKSILILFDGSDEKIRDEIIKFGDRLRKNQSKVKLLSYIDSKGELTDFGMAVYNNKSINIFGFPKKDILQLLESEKFDILFNLNLENHKHLHALACKADASFKISLPTELKHDFTLIIKTKEKKNIKKIIDEVTTCLAKLSI